MATITINTQDAESLIILSNATTFADHFSAGGSGVRVTNKLITPLTVGDTLYYPNTTNTITSNWYQMLNWKTVDGVFQPVDVSREMGTYTLYVDSFGIITYFEVTNTTAFTTPGYNLSNWQKSTKFMYISTGYATRALAEAATTSTDKVWSNFSGVGDEGWGSPDIQMEADTNFGLNIPISASAYPYSDASEGYVEQYGYRLFDAADEARFKVRAHDAFNGQEQYYLVTTTPTATLADDINNKVIYIDLTGKIDPTK